MEMVASAEKRIIRKELLTKLLSLTQEEIKRRSKNVETTLKDVPIYKKAKHILVYYPLAGEVDLLEMMRKEFNKRFCFPVIDMQQKMLHPYGIQNLDEDFVVGPYGVMQPDIKKTKKTALAQIDVVIVPGLAFDRQKNRLGRGGGFYDRFLAHLPSSIATIGVAFGFQILNRLPIHPAHDQKVGCVVSEHEVI